MVCVAAWSLHRSRIVATAGCFGSWPLTGEVLLMEELHGQESCAFGLRVPMHTQKSRLMQIAGKNGFSKPYEAGEQTSSRDFPILTAAVLMASAPLLSTPSTSRRRKPRSVFGYWPPGPSCCS